MHACLTEEINLLYKIDPKLTAKGKAMSIERLQKRENRRNLKQVNYQLLTEISNATQGQMVYRFENLKG